MKCVFCGGKVEKTNVTFVYEDPENYIMVENVPAEVCSHCGEKTYSHKVTEELIRIAKHKFQPKKTINIPVFDFSDKELVHS